MKGIFKEITPEKITDNVFKIIGNDWMLISAGDIEKSNCMTASWGGMGVLWNKNVCFCFIRPQRYTYEFVENKDCFTLSFFEDDYKNVLNFCGSNSGRDFDKPKETGITPIIDEVGTIYYKEARLVIMCRKIYFQDIIPDNFLDTDIANNYPKRDYHRMYVGEIIKCLIKE